MNDSNRTILRRILCIDTDSWIADHSHLLTLEPATYGDTVFYISVEPVGPVHWWTIACIASKSIRTARIALDLRKAYYKTLEEYGL